MPLLTHLHEVMDELPECLGTGDSRDGDHSSARYYINWPIIVSTLLSPIRLSVAVCLSVTLVHPTQAVEIFGNISTAFGTLATS